MGTRKLIKQKISGQASLSTDGKFVLFFDNGHYYTYSMATGKTVDITAPLPNVHFDQETWSTPSTPAAWGVAGWTKGDKSVLLYDRFDSYAYLYIASWGMGLAECLIAFTFRPFPRARLEPVAA